MVGTLVGAFLATVLFSTTVIALPMLAEREVDFVTAMITSVATVVKNPLPMLGFGFIVGLITLMALLPVFAGLLMALPVTGACDLASVQTAGDVARLSRVDQLQESWRISGLAELRVAAAAILEQEAEKAADAISDLRDSERCGRHARRG
jgi:hypothetical protein